MVQRTLGLLYRTILQTSALIIGCEKPYIPCGRDLWVEQWLEVGKRWRREWGRGGGRERGKSWGGSREG